MLIKRKIFKRKTKTRRNPDTEGKQNLKSAKIFLENGEYDKILYPAAIAYEEYSKLFKANDKYYPEYIESRQIMIDALKIMDNSEYTEIFKNESSDYKKGILNELDDVREILISYSTPVYINKIDKLKKRLLKYK